MLFFKKDWERGKKLDHPFGRKASTWCATRVENKKKLN